MDQPTPAQAEGGQAKQWFMATHWSVVLAAGQASPQQQASALETLCRTYWEPLYAYLRSLGYDRDDAQDLTQSFFAHLMARRPFATLSPQKGKFRSYLLKSLQHFLADQHDRSAAAKRGGGQLILSLEAEVAERHYSEAGTEPGPPETSFDRRWAVTLLNRAFSALQQEYLASDKTTHFLELSVFLATEGNAGEYTATARKLQMTSGAVAVAVHRLRSRYRECIHAEVAHTVAQPGEVEEEMRYLLEVLCH